MSIVNEMNSIRANINLIKQFSEIPEYSRLQKSMLNKINKLDPTSKEYTDKVYEIVKNSEYFKKMKELLPSFSVEFEALFIMALRGSDLGPLEFMLNTMENISNGTISKDKGEMSIGEHLGDKFILKKNSK